MCYDNFYIRSDSNNVCAQSANISVRVSAGNVVGNGSESSPIYIQIGKLYYHNIYHSYVASLATYTACTLSIIADTNIDSDTYIESKY